MSGSPQNRRILLLHSDPLEIERLTAGLNRSGFTVVAADAGRLAMHELVHDPPCLVLAAEGTKFNLAYTNLGTSADLGGSWALARLVGLRHALEIALLGDSFSADDLREGLQAFLDKRTPQFHGR